MEFIYFPKPESTIAGVNIYNARKQMWINLAKANSVDADVVIGVPNSGIPAAIGFSEEAKIPFEAALIKNKQVARTSIQSSKNISDKSVLNKFTINVELVKDKKVVVVDDSIVRGTTIKRIVQILNEAGTKEVHVRIASPPFKYPCFFGIDIPNQDSLIAWKMTDSEIGVFLSATSLEYLSEEDLIKSIIHPIKRELMEDCVWLILKGIILLSYMIMKKNLTVESVP